jgi:hypothetical protein
MAVAQNYYWKTVTDMRWDSLAEYGYGDVSYTPDLIAANTAIPMYEFVPAGVWVIFPFKL